MTTANLAITEADIAALQSQSDATLAEWWCELNHWRWPAGLSNPEPQTSCTNRRSDIMSWIHNKIGHRACLREWNKEMDDLTFKAMADSHGWK